VTAIQLTEKLFDAWNRRDWAAASELIAPNGILSMPMATDRTGQAGSDTILSRLVTAFPDVRFIVSRVTPSEPDRAIAEFRIVGTHSASSDLGPATGRRIQVNATMVVTVEDSRTIASAEAYWDTQEVLDALGMKNNPTPNDVPGLLDFGVAIRVHTGRTDPPGCFTATSIDAEGGDANWVAEQSNAIITDLFGEPGYLGSVLASAGNRHFTFSAWTSPEASDAAMDSDSHRDAMRELLSGAHGTRVMTSLWVPLQLNSTKSGGHGRRFRPVRDAEPWL
jgi:steroid delta-isomerase-like uncharacterized protein